MEKKKNEAIQAFRENSVNSCITAILFLLLLEYNRFAMLLVSAAQQSESVPTTHPCHCTPPGHHRAPNRTPVLYSSFPLAVY